MIQPVFFTVKGETPAKKNSRITLRNGRTIPSAKFRQWHVVALAQLEIQCGKLPPFDPIAYPVTISLDFYHSDNRRRDSDNGTSSILDLLQDACILKDDCWQIVRTLKIRNHKADEARCDISILLTEN